MLICIFFTFIFVLPDYGMLANNPIIPKIGMADPHIFVFNGKVYLYATRDADSTANEFVMPDWNIWSSVDLIHWSHEATIKPEDTYMGVSNNCWAPDVAEKNGSYYFYFSNGNVNTGVMKASSPAGSFKDALGKPLLPESLTPGKEYDPTILMDDDEQAYIVFGHYREADKDLNYYIAKLGDDMISLSETPKEIEISGDMNVLKGNDKPNLHKRNGIYYLSAGTHYATSENIYGPFIRTGETGNGKHGLDSRAHGNFFEWNSQWFHTWCHFYLGKDVARYRESYIGYLHYKNNGDMVDDTTFLNTHFETGVGQYDAGWEKIEAEWYMAAGNVEKKENPNWGFEIQKVKNNGYLYFPNVKNLDEVSSAVFHLSSEMGGSIEVHANNVDGPVLGSVYIKTTGGFQKYNDVICNLTNLKGVENIYLVFKGNSMDLCHLDWFRFE